MSSILPITWNDKKNSPLLADFIAKHGPEFCMTAEEINQLKNAVNEMAAIQKTTFLGVAEPTDTPAGTGRGYWEVITPGTYTSFGGVVLGPDERGLIARDESGIFKLSKAEFDFGSYIKTNSIFMPTKNLFDKSKAKENYYISPSGEETLSVGSGFSVSEFIEILPSTTYHKNTWHLGAFYDANKNVVSTFGNEVYVLQSPANAKYVRYTIIAADLNRSQLEIGDKETSYETFKLVFDVTKVEDKSFPIEKLSEQLFVIGKNLFDKSKAKENYYISPSGEETLSVGSGFSVSEFIEILPSTTYHKNTWHLGAFYDANKNVVSTFGNEVYVLQSPANAKYVRYTIIAADLNRSQLEIGDKETSYETFKLVFDLSRIENNSLPIEKISGSFSNANFDTTTVDRCISSDAPVFFSKYKNQKEDVTVVLLGDSISTTNYYTTTRPDANKRPPLMVENAYVTEIEEQLRWDGQKYYRYDTPGVFTEVSSIAALTKEYDQAWDWIGSEPQANYNNRPALTRILSGNNASVSYNIPANSVRCDFIFRTDYLNAANATVTIEGGNGKVLIFNDATNLWVEANGFVYSAKEVDSIMYANLRKSMYQKRLKMKNLSGYTGKVVITNTGSGRLTYWGIQTGIREFMFDFILSARGGHSIDRLNKFEPWDLDYFKPQLILWEIPILNQNLDLANPDFSPKNVGANTNDFFAETISSKAVQLKSKLYTPELITWIMFFGSGNNAITQNDEWAYGISNDGAVSVPSYISRTIFKLKQEGVVVKDLFSLYIDFIKKGKKQNGLSIYQSLIGSGIEGNSLTIDGGHFNNKGANVTSSIFRGYFIK